MQLITNITLLLTLFLLIAWLGEENEGEGNLFIGGSLLAGSLAGLTSKSITYPFDLARKRMQIQGFQDARTGFGKVISSKTLWLCILFCSKTIYTINVVI